MRPTIVLTAVIALALAPAADAGLARYAAEEGESLSLKRGRGTALIVNRDGAVLGTVRRGRVVITDVQRGAETDVAVSRSERRRYPRRHTVVCAGRYLRFSALGGAWRVRLMGAGINASAVMNGYVTFDNGAAGTYSIRHSDPRPWPATARTFYLG